MPTAGAAARSLSASAFSAFFRSPSSAFFASPSRRPASCSVGARHCAGSPAGMLLILVTYCWNASFVSAHTWPVLPPSIPHPLRAPSATTPPASARTTPYRIASSCSVPLIPDRTRI